MGVTSWRVRPLDRSALSTMLTSSTRKDGLLDLFVAVDGHANLLYEQQADRTFAEIAAAAGVASTGAAKGVAVLDADNDGDTDIFVHRWDAKNLLYRRNNDDATFTEMAYEAGVDDAGHGTGVAAVDYDGDNDIDLHLCKYDEPNVFYRNNAPAVERDRVLFVRPLDPLGRTHTGAGMAAIVSVFLAGTTTRVVFGDVLDEEAVVT